MSGLQKWRVVLPYESLSLGRSLLSVFYLSNLCQIKHSNRNNYSNYKYATENLLNTDYMQM